MPSTPADARALLRTAIRDDNPVVFFEHKLLYFQRGEVPEQQEELVFGRAAVRREGRHATVVAAQAMLGKVLAVAGRLASEGINLEVIDPRTLVPFDIETVVESVRKTNRLLICHEATERGGWAAEIAMQVGELAFDHLDAPVARVCGANVPIPYSTPLETAVVPGEAAIEQGLRALLAGARWSPAGIG
ncbi:MAG TPA: transketolase C-terminal domain-containing protein, partial [Candidatus Dormibacteraeota bacterium]|jgi:pyruvate dehydrogenase E1 component beta subunit